MTLLVTAAEVITLAFQDKNLLAAKIKDVFIEAAQENFLRSWLGDNLYEDLIKSTPAGDNKTLVDSYLKKPLSFFIKYTVLPELVVNVNNTGGQVIQPGGTLAASDKQTGMLREQSKDIAETLMRNAIRFINANPTKYPLYENDTTQRTYSKKVIGGIVF